MVKRATHLEDIGGEDQEDILEDILQKMKVFFMKCWMLKIFFSEVSTAGSTTKEFRRDGKGFLECCMLKILISDTPCHKLLSQMKVAERRMKFLLKTQGHRNFTGRGLKCSRLKL
ncbi:hypothetical protein CDAR_26551 [Caerostris darwini]|uniref:Uncharacterized protein n=1 Tax=Caerostris darwini TaxID=1538125 RepID=A0AAV4QFH9_9ARAC|nr:hypothetical protein CDAR_26551 [Caerostris darwini]